MDYLLTVMLNVVLHTVMLNVVKHLLQILR